MTGEFTKREQAIIRAIAWFLVVLSVVFVAALVVAIARSVF